MFGDLQVNSFLRAQFEKCALLLRESDLQTDLELAVEMAFSEGAPPFMPKPKATTPEKKEPKLDMQHKHEHNHSDSDSYVGEHYVTSPYGERVDPISGAKRFHSGIDLRAKEGTEILSWNDGTIVAVKEDGRSGKYVIIDHPEGFRTSYSHLSEQFVSPGQQVAKGQPIGLAGSTGRSTGSHLHFRMEKDRRRIDPTPYLTNSRVVGSRIIERS